MYQKGDVTKKDWDRDESLGSYHLVILQLPNELKVPKSHLRSSMNRYPLLFYDG
jgi:hypothetical protein